MVELKNCIKCGKIFATTIREICPDCYRQEEKAFQLVYQFLRKRKNREATIPQIVHETGVEEALIIKFMKEKRLRISQHPHLNYPCEKCSNPISEGNYCLTCLKKFKQSWTSETERNSHTVVDDTTETVYFTMDHLKKKNEK